MDPIEHNIKYKALGEKYVAKKKRLKFMKRLTAWSGFGVFVMCVIAFCVMSQDRFTITTSNAKELSLSEYEDKRSLTTKLYADPLTDAMDCQYTDIPENIDKGMGCKNYTKANEYCYFAYSFYLIGNASDTQIDKFNYYMDFTLTDSSLALESALRIMVIKDGIKTVYAKAGDDGTPKKVYAGDRGSEYPNRTICETIPFKENNEHIIMEPYSITPETRTKYTIVMWIDGWESAETMKNGTIDLNLRFSLITYNE